MYTYSRSGRALRKLRAVGVLVHTCNPSTPEVRRVEARLAYGEEAGGGRRRGKEGNKAEMRKRRRTVNLKRAWKLQTS